MMRESFTKRFLENCQNIVGMNIPAPGIFWVLTPTLWSILSGGYTLQLIL